MQDDIGQVSIAGMSVRVTHCFDATHSNCANYPADATEAVRSGSAQQYSATAEPDGLRLNLPVLSDLSASAHETAALSRTSSPRTTLQRSGSRGETSRVRAPCRIFFASFPIHVQEEQAEDVIELEDMATDDLQSLLLSELTRDYTKLESTQINEGNILRSGDRLILSAKLENLQHLRHTKGKGLSIGDSVINGLHDVESEFVELVVSHRCPHIGKPINSRCHASVCSLASSNATSSQGHSAGL